MDTRTLGANIQKYRKDHNLTQEQAAESCGLSVGYYRQIEQGHKLPKLETFIKIAEVLGTPTDKLLSGNVTLGVCETPEPA
ncbi:helix-turn-helix transcriptional regulator [Blautia coccoides]|uniref:helix-turn-helix domain-containing protein n=1 Tax=Blautia producta TaxID=33035 RepID=UPI0028A32108|nr:helix-turn-helix transcriptional regulator [Blautia coccoides]MDT4375381.1 helix-turn-helix transcriptional regulator [Blautia coccoides]